jgi:hypothetical protein
VVLATTQRFIANSFTGTVAWSVNSVAGGNATVGTIDSTGLYTAPSTQPSPNTITVTATAGTQTASVAAAVVYPNHNQDQQAGAIKLGSSGGNATDTGTNVCCIGTLGSLVTRGGLFFILSNNHVLDKSSFGAPGDQIRQAGAAACFSSSQVVATLTQGAALAPAGTTVGRTGAAPSNVDAAIAQVVSTTLSVDNVAGVPTGTILDLGAAGATTIADAPPSATLAAPATVLANNTQVAKSGRTSSLTCSTLSSVSTGISVSYETSCGSNVTAFIATFTNQVIVNGGTFSASGDSGSLIVTADQARPLALLYGGSSTSTVGNPIQDVLGAFLSGANAATMVGGADHAVSCKASLDVAPFSTTASASAATVLAPQERQRATMVQQLHAKTIMRDAVVQSVTVGASDDNPGEGALVVEVSAVPRTPIPAVIDGVRTKVVYSAQAAVMQPRITEADITRTVAIKDSSAAGLMGQSGIQGVGVGLSSDAPGETAIVIYIITGQPHQEIPATIGGVRTKIIAGTRFKAY